MLASTPRIVTRTGGANVATGVVIAVRDGAAFVLTAQHATPEADEREVQFFSRESYPNPDLRFRAAEVVRRWERPDLALLKVTLGPEHVTPARLAAPGQRPRRFPFEAMSVGCSHGAEPTFRAEQVVAKRPARRPGGGIAFFWELAVPPVPGRSGGPLLDCSGAVIGLCAATRDGRGYYIHLDEVQVVLKEAGYDWLWAGAAAARP